VLLKEVMAAINEGLPNAANRPPGEVFEHVLLALRQADAKPIAVRKKFKIRTVLFAPAKLMNDITDRFYN
jgi:hypothetical protein